MRHLTSVTFITLTLINWVLGCVDLTAPSNSLKLWLTVSARKRYIEVSWQNAPARVGDNILLTRKDPHSFEKRLLRKVTPLARFNSGEGSGFVPLEGFTTTTARYSPLQYGDIIDDDGSGDDMSVPFMTRIQAVSSEYWVSSNGEKDVVAAIEPSLSTQWFTTGVPFDLNLMNNITMQTCCYGYWASYINSTGSILAKTCISVYPRWMNEMRSIIGDLRLRDLFIPGTHDSGSYRDNFDPLLKETIITKYALTQDDDIHSQLMHGVRYLDIRVGYYKNTQEKFFINHGITRHSPLLKVINDVKDFVMETNEIVIFGLKEFPVGFGKNLGVHRLLVTYLRENFENFIVHPSATWSSTLRDIWSRKQNIILAYDKSPIVFEYPHLFFSSVDQRWGNEQKWDKLELFLRLVHGVDVSRLSSRPVADMAELTPDTWGVLLDKFGGLRKMADDINWRLSHLYRDELGRTANIVAVDFLRGTTITEIAIDWNKRKALY